MNVPAKLHLLKKFARLFPKWSLRQQALVIERSFDSGLAKASWQARQEIMRDRAFEADEYRNALAELRSRQLVRRAQKHYVRLDGLVWDSDQYGNQYLSNATESQLYQAVKEERRKAWEFRLKIIGILTTALTGLVGTIIGLVAILKK